MRARVDAVRTGRRARRALRPLGAQEVELSAQPPRRGARERGRGRARPPGGRGDEARRRLEEAGAEPAEGDAREALAERVERLERRRRALGQVNPLAKQEYEAEKERLEELSSSAPISRRASPSSSSFGPTSTRP